MDEINIVSDFLTDLISKIIKSQLKKNLDYNIDISLNEVRATVIDGKTRLHLDVNAELDKDELLKILQNAGLP